MDPNETLLLLQFLANENPNEIWAQEFTSLNDWMTRGGFPPDSWTAWLTPEQKKYRGRTPYLRFDVQGKAKKGGLA